MHVFFTLRISRFKNKYYDGTNNELYGYTLYIYVLKYIFTLGCLLAANITWEDFCHEANYISVIPV